MKRSLRLLVAVIAALLAATLLQGCGSTKSQNGVTIQKDGWF